MCTKIYSSKLVFQVYIYSVHIIYTDIPKWSTKSPLTFSTKFLPLTFLSNLLQVFIFYSLLILKSFDCRNFVYFEEKFSLKKRELFFYVGHKLYICFLNTFQRKLTMKKIAFLMFVKETFYKADCISKIK